jgi:molybdate transport system ATP-binding protein
VLVRRGAFTLDAQLDARPGNTLVVVGPNGAGKSTLVSAIAGVIGLDGGSIAVGGRVLADVASGIDLPTERRRVGVVFQDYLLFPHLTALENVAFGPRATRMPDPRGIAADWLERLGVAELATRRPSQLSGGQQQRVALARALAADPEVLLLDEPLAALDVEVRDEVRAELARHLAVFGGVSVVVTHSLDDLTALGRDVVVLEAGRVTQRATVSELLLTPATPYTRRLVAG